MNLRTKIFYLFLFLIVAFPITSNAQEQFRVMFYNVENLYDTINNPQTLDDEFAPDGDLRWGSYRYHKKLEDISKIISSLGGEYPPAIVGLCEVENKEVIKDLIFNSSLAKHKYKYRITNSKDARGSNVALLYQRDQFRLLQKRSYRPVLDANGKATRDILHIVGTVVSGDTLDVFVCHYPSRSDGVVKSNPLRVAVSEFLKMKIDNVRRIRKNANIIVMGDFNDYPSDESIRDVLGAKGVDGNANPSKLYNLFLNESKSLEGGSYKYQGKWGFLDQFVVSGNLLNTNNTTYILNCEASVYKPDYLLDYDEKYGGKKPFRTYSGWKYLGGASDHLPIYMDLYIKE